MICADQRCREGVFSATLPAGYLKKARILAQEYKVQLTVTERRGLRFSFYRVKFRYGAALGILGILLVFFWVSNLIVKVEVTGNAAVPEAQIRRVLEEIGIDQGAWIPGHSGVSLGGHPAYRGESGGGCGGSHPPARHAA